jgi:hypothetical protein
LNHYPLEAGPGDPTSQREDGVPARSSCRGRCCSIRRRCRPKPAGWLGCHARDLAPLGGDLVTMRWWDDVWLNEDRDVVCRRRWAGGGVRAGVAGSSRRRLSRRARRSRATQAQWTIRHGGGAVRRDENNKPVGVAMAEGEEPVRRALRRYLSPVGGRLPISLHDEAEAEARYRGVARLRVEARTSRIEMPRAVTTGASCVHAAAFANRWRRRS